MEKSGEVLIERLHLLGVSDQVPLLEDNLRILELQELLSQKAGRKITLSAGHVGDTLRRSADTFIYVCRSADQSIIGVGSIFLRHELAGRCAVLQQAVVHKDRDDAALLVARMMDEMMLCASLLGAETVELDSGVLFLGGLR